MLYSRVSSGLDFLDASIGGIFSNRCYMLRGPAQSGRTTAALKFLMGSLENDENAMLISSDRIENVILKAETMGLSIEQYLMDNRLILNEYPKEFITGDFEYSHIIKLLGEIEQYLEHYNCSRLAFDTVLPLLSKRQNTHLVNYIYSLVNSLEALGVTTLITAGEPNSPSAQRIIQLMEDAVVGSFVMSNLASSKSEQRYFAVHKLVDPISPPKTFKIRMETGSGIVEDIPSDTKTAAVQKPKLNTKTLQKLPLLIAVIDSNEDIMNQVEEIFHKDTQIAVFESQAEYTDQMFDFEFDYIIINANLPNLNWREFIQATREHMPKMPVFLVTEKLNSNLTHQVTRQAGANGLFKKPIDQDDIMGALVKCLKDFGTFDDLVAKRQIFSSLTDMPEDLTEIGMEVTPTNGGGSEELGILSPNNFREKLFRLIWRSKQNNTNLTLVSFKMVYTGNPAQQENMPQGLELVKKVSQVVQSSLRGLDDSTCRYMDKVVAMLEDSEIVGAQAFARRIIRELSAELYTQLNLQVGKHLNILTAIRSFPEHADNGDELMEQVTNISTNFVKTIV